MADALSRNSKEGVEVVGVRVCALSSLALRSREQLMREQKEDKELGSLYRYLENPDLVQSVDRHMFQNWSQFLKLIDGLLLYSETVNS